MSAYGAKRARAYGRRWWNFRPEATVVWREPISFPREAHPSPERVAEVRDAIWAELTAAFADAIAQVSGTNEALVFRHFGSKPRLYLACVDAAWQRMLDRCDELYAAESEARHWRMPGRSFLELVRSEPAVAQMWMRGLVETTGGVLPGRSSDGEAWTIIALGLLGASLGTRGLVEPDEYDAVLSAHRDWMTGSPD